MVENDDLTCVYFAMEFEPDVTLLQKIVDAAATCQAELDAPKNLAMGINLIIIRDASKRLAAHFSPQRIFYQSIGARIWRDQASRVVRSVRAVISQLGNKELKRVGFRTQLYAGVGMTHPELVASTFGAYLADRESLQMAFGALDDVSVSLYGSRSGRKFRASISPQTEKDVRLSFLADAGLEFVLENKFIDLGVKEFYDRINRDCLNVDVDMWQEQIRIDLVPAFLSAAIEDTRQLTENALRVAQGFHPA